MHVLVRVDVPIPADEFGKGFERLRGLLIVKFDGGDDEIADLDMAGREALARAERGDNISTMSCGSIMA